MSKIRFILVFGVIIGVWLISYILHHRMLKPSLDINSINLENVRSIKIDDRGILGNKSIEVSNAKRVKCLSKLIIASSKVNYDEINFKDNQGLCEIELQLKNKENLILVMTKTNLTGGILRSGDFCYRNDSLLNIISETLRSNLQ
jgi:hypothetical protein